VVADDRDAAGPVVAYLRTVSDVRLEVRRLVTGDYEVDGQFLFERKTLPDLAQSIADGRLFRQCLRLLRRRKRVALILEGTSADLAGCRMRREAIQGALVSVSLLLGVPVLRAMDPRETGNVMLYAARQLRDWSMGGLPRGGRRPRGKLRSQLRILQGLPGVGPDRARKLLARFGNVQGVIQAAETELREVSGVGSGTAARIRWAVEEGTGTYAVGTPDI
jgi:ERCC4-type nuclease